MLGVPGPGCSGYVVRTFPPPKEFQRSGVPSLPNFTLPGDVSPSERYWERDIVLPEWTMDGEGWIDVPVDRPGMGVQPDLDRIEDLTTRREDLRAR